MVIGSARPVVHPFRVLECLRPFLPKTLVPEGDFLWARGISRRAPDIACLGFEAGLDRTGADFAVCVPVAGGKAAAFAAAIDGGCQGESALGRPGLAAILGAWPIAAPDGYQDLDTVWYSFDRNAGKPDGDAANLHLGILPGDRSRDSNARLSVDTLQGCCEPHFPGYSGPMPDWAALMRCIRLLPPCATLWNVSRMLSRSPVSWKLNLSISRASLRGYLDAVGWPGDIQNLETWVSEVAPWEKDVRLDLTVHGGVQMRLGWEIFSGRGAHSDVRRRETLDRLVAMGICRPRSRDSVLAWSGFSDAGESGEGGAMMLGRNWYAKLTLGENSSVMAKAYLACVPRMLRKDKEP